MCATTQRHQVTVLLLQNVSSNWWRSRSNDSFSVIVIFFIFVTCVALVVTNILLTVVYLLIFPQTCLCKIVALFQHDKNYLISVPEIFFPLLSFFRLFFSYFCHIFLDFKLFFPLSRCFQFLSILALILLPKYDL